MEKSNPKELWVIVGPTASGKSDLAVKIAKKIKGEIISADSRQVYKGMDIGSGKITKKEMAGMPHHLLSVASPNSTFSVGKYVKLARKVIREICARKRIPIIVGGTGFYIDSLVYSIPLPEVKPNLKLRKKLGNKSSIELFKILSKIDPEKASLIDRNNPRRLIRAIELAKAGASTKFKITDFYTNKTTTIGETRLKLKWIGINPPNGVLRRNITKRLDSRLKKGMVREISNLHKKGVSWKKLESFGLEYKWGAMLLRGKVSQQEFRLGIINDILNYAKRQMRWFKRNENIKWVKKPTLSSIGL